VFFRIEWIATGTDTIERISALAFVSVIAGSVIVLFP
jgi:hypothetical protein